MTARAIRNMQVPAYWPVEAGVQAVEYNGVVVDIVKTDMCPAEDMSMAIVNVNEETTKR